MMRQLLFTSVAAVCASLSGSCTHGRWELVSLEGNAHAPPILSLASASESEIWATNGVGALQSLDGGRNWQVRLADQDASYEMVRFRNSELGWIFGSRRLEKGASRGEVWRTADGGQHWASTATIATSSITSAELCGSVMFAVSSQQVLFSADGLTWTESLTESGEVRFTSLSCSDESHVWAIDTHGLLFDTADGG